MKVKVCGMRDPENIRQIAALKPDYMGFIFYEGSKRYAEGHITPILLKEIPATTRKTGVFVNASTKEIKDIVARYSLDAVQLHGRETPRECLELRNLGLEVIKVFSVDDKFAFENALLYESSTDYFLFDTRGKEYGGNGIPFDWELLKNNLSPKPYFLSGGLNLENLKHLHKVRPKPVAVDINSGFESEPGLKDVEQVRLLLEQLKTRI